MKNLFTTTTALFFALSIFAQDQAIEFTYDAVGNRTERHIIELKKIAWTISRPTKAPKLMQPLPKPLAKA
jgi:YD repeat-containing protein